MDTPASLLFVAAEPREFSGLLPFCKTVARLSWPLDWVRAAELNGRRVLLATNGAGAAHAARAVEAALANEPVAAVVSTGFCGALDPGLQVGSVFVASAIQGASGRLPALAPGTPAAHASGLLASIDHIAQTSEEKRRLRAAGASAVEMEAAGVAAAAGRAGLPFFCVRSVTDLLEESFANDFNAVLRSDGHFATIDLLASAVRRPTVLLPELFRLRKRCIVAARTLGEFLANCRF
jgi:adenosylhomocysteine nucleosidase